MSEALRFALRADETRSGAIVGKAVLRPEDLSEHPLRMPGGRSSLLVLPVLIAIPALLSVLPGRLGTAWSAGILVQLTLALVFAVLLWKSSRARIAKLLNRDSLVGRELTFGIDDYGCSVDWDESQSFVAWERVRGFTETSRTFVLLNDPAGVEIIPKRAFSAEDLPLVRDLLLRHTAQRGRRPTSVSGVRKRVLP